MKIWDSKGYHTLDELARYGYHTSMGESTYSEMGRHPPYNGFEAIQDHPALRKKLSEILARKGLRRFEYVGNGDFAIVLKTAENMVVRISVDTEENHRVKHPCILQPIAAFKVKTADPDTPVLRVELLPQLRDKKNDEAPYLPYLDDDITAERIKTLKDALRDSGLNPHDVLPRNIALLHDGTPIVIDGGAVDVIADQKTTIDKKRLAAWFSQDKNGNDVWKQHQFHPEILRGINGSVINDKKLRRLQDFLGEDHPVCQAIVQDGLYTKEADWIISNALEEMTLADARNKPASFREAMDMARASFKKNEDSTRGRA